MVLDRNNVAPHVTWRCSSFMVLFICWLELFNSDFNGICGTDEMGGLNSVV
jgi:hypothetical protein